MTPRERNDLSTIVALLLVVVLAFLIGSFIRPSGIYPDRRSPVTEQRTPAPEPLVVNASVTKYVERSAACRNPGGTNRAGYCWYEGWSFTRRTICIDSSIPGAPLAAVAKMYTGIGGLKVVVGGKAGGCQEAGYPAGQRVSFLSMSKNTAAHWGYGVCALTSPANYGNLTSVNITVYITGPQRTPCGGQPEWTDVFAHEFGHALGISHNQPHASSIMRDGHSPDASDSAKLAQIYSTHRA